MHRKRLPAAPGCFLDLLPEGIAAGNSPGGVGVGEHADAVVGVDCLQPGHARHERLTPAGKAGKKMGFDVAGEDFQVAFQQLPVEPDLVAG